MSDSLFRHHDTTVLHREHALLLTCLWPFRNGKEVVCHTGVKVRTTNPVPGNHREQKCSCHEKNPEKIFRENVFVSTMMIWVLIVLIYFETILMFACNLQLNYLSGLDCHEK